MWAHEFLCNSYNSSVCLKLFKTKCKCENNKTLVKSLALRDLTLGLTKTLS
jgi:hypothetical protein